MENSATGKRLEDSVLNQDFEEWELLNHQRVALGDQTCHDCWSLLLLYVKLKLGIDFS